MRQTTLLTALGFLALCQCAWTEPTPPQEQLGDLLITLSNMQTTKTVGRYNTAQSGFHYLRVNVVVKNVGSKTVCTSLSAGIETSLGSGSKSGQVKLTARNKTDTVRGGYIRQMLPSEEAEGYIIFAGVRDGVGPESLTVTSGGQSCDPRWYTYQLEAVTFAVTSSQNRFVIATKKPAPKAALKESAPVVTASEPPAPPKPCAAADSASRSTAQSQ